METFYGWIRNIICYLLFISVIENLLPGKKYHKYLKLFSGMILILLIIQPVASGLRLDDKIARYYESFVFRYESDDLKNELLGMEDKRLEQMISQYEEAIAGDLAQMAREEGVEAVSCRVVIERDQTHENFGQVESISMQVRSETSQESESPESVITSVEPVVIGPAAAAGTTEGNQEQQHQKRSEVTKLQQKIVSYYDLEDEYVEIQFVEG